MAPRHVVHLLEEMGSGAAFKHAETCPGTLQGGKGSFSATGDKVVFSSVLFGETTEREFTRR